MAGSSYGYDFYILFAPDYVSSMINSIFAPVNINLGAFSPDTDFAKANVMEFVSDKLMTHSRK